MQAARRMALLAALIFGIAPLAARAVDAGLDGGSDTDADTDTDLCDGACESVTYNACACGPDDPCDWAGDGVCDEACIASGWVEEMFDDSADCDPSMDGGTDTDTDSDADTDTGTDTGTDSGVAGSLGSLSDTACNCSHVGGAARRSLLQILARAI
jgi:hypothetical protein